MQSFSEYRFNQAVQRASARVSKILDNTRHPQSPSEVPHKYDDKYLLAELATRGAAAAHLNLLATLGLDAPKLAQLSTLAQSKMVTLRFSSVEKCAFNRTTVRDEESATKHVSERTGFFAGTTTHKTVTTITEHFWDFTASWELFAYAGADPTQHKVELAGRMGRMELKTTGKGNEDRHPKPTSSQGCLAEVDVTWLLQRVAGAGEVGFTIDRSAKSCRTPRRNEDVDGALVFGVQFCHWARSVRGYFTGKLWPVCPASTHGLDLSAATAADTFAPVTALFALEAPPAEAAAIEEEDNDGDQAQATPLVVGDFPAFLGEQARSLGAKQDSLALAFPDPVGAAASPVGGGLQLITRAEAWLAAACDHAGIVCQQHADVLDAVEALLRSQLAAAVGKELGPADFDEYMAFHNRLLFKSEFAPAGWCFALRRSPAHSPEGVLSIETSGDRQPVQTLCAHRRVGPARAMRFALSAAAEVSFSGDQFLHAAVLHRFSGQAAPRLQLNARARQFSSFVLLVGKIAAADMFEPTGALIVKDKDDLRIPLLLETLPTAQEFRDAVESMSPEQQRFAKAFRSMQLASSLFGVVVIQIKPQLERLLNLPADALTKEIQLTQDLMEIFIQYQVPSDLIAYDPSNSLSNATPLAAVKAHVRALLKVVADAKAKELEAVRQEEEKKMRERAVVARNAPPPMPCAPMPAMARCGAPAPRGPPGAMRMVMAKGGGGGGMMKNVRRKMKKSAPRPQPAAMQMDMMGSAAPAPASAPKPKPDPKPAAADPAAPPQQQTQQTQQQQQQTQQQRSSDDDGRVDYTAVPAALDRQFEKLDEDGAMRPTTIKPGPVWTRRSQAGLLSDPKSESLGAAEQKRERGRAFDLLDALTRSGALPVEHAALHVVLAATHCFDKTLVDTVIQDNVNPIEKVERSMLIVASTVQGRPARELIRADQRKRVATFSPGLGIEDVAGEA